MREIVIDTETTGLEPGEGHRIVEIGAIELVDHIPTGERLHHYINPEREIASDAARVHGITNEQLADKPVFREIADEFLEFIGDSRLVIHNAEFDMGFINAELERMGDTPLPADRALCTMKMAREKIFQGSVSLDGLCRRFEIDNSHRDLHGALVDADLLASVYLELLGGRQRGLSLDADDTRTGNPDAGALSASDNAQAPGADIDTRFDRPHEPSDAEIAAHGKLVSRIPNPVWEM